MINMYVFLFLLLLIYFMNVTAYIAGPAQIIWANALETHTASEC